MADHITQIRIGVIGLGEVAQIIHLPILRALPDRYRVTAICDVSPSLLGFIGERYEIPAVATPGRLRRIPATISVSSR